MEQTTLSAPSELDDRNLRYRDIVPLDKLAKVDVSIVGVGAIGRQVARQLATLGCPRMKLWDHDVVEVVNLGAQGYFEADLDKPKVIATQSLIKAINSRIEVDPRHELFKTRDGSVGNVLFVCVDKISTRGRIVENLQPCVELMVDGRMAAESMHILTVHDEESRIRYESTIFPQNEAYVGSCTGRTTCYTADVAAGFMVTQFTRWLRGFPLVPEFRVNLFSTLMFQEPSESH